MTFSHAYFKLSLTIYLPFQKGLLMYYTWYQWLLMFYIFSFFGWIFESAYVSLKKKRFVNRGFLRLPMLPLYGTGAVLLLWITLPFRENLLMVYAAGVVAATVLEYLTGWTMERLFKVKYWDYSNQHFQLNGYICLSSSIAWGFLTIFLTEVILDPISHLLWSIAPLPSILCCAGISVLFGADTVQSVRAALNLAKVLEAMTRMQGDSPESRRGQRHRGSASRAVEGSGRSQGGSTSSAWGTNGRYRPASECCGGRAKRPFGGKTFFPFSKAPGPDFQYGFLPKRTAARQPLRLLSAIRRCFEGAAGSCFGKMAER